MGSIPVIFISFVSIFRLPNFSTCKKRH
uniref:Uncharacterized protein n=1 Tax=Arundo donax TaxID=35708 RepID=A0A0A8ZMH3_ARUDO